MGRTAAEVSMHVCAVMSQLSLCLSEVWVVQDRNDNKITVLSREALQHCMYCFAFLEDLNSSTRFGKQPKSYFGLQLRKRALSKFLKPTIPASPVRPDNVQLSSYVSSCSLRRCRSRDAVASSSSSVVAARDVTLPTWAPVLGQSYT